MDDLYSNRKIYRDISKKKELFSFRVSIEETDLYIQASQKDLEELAKKKVIDTRLIIKKFIDKHPHFQTSLKPLNKIVNPPDVIAKMLEASQKANLGPMASVAGALSQETGLFLLNYCEEIVVENGGDIFIKSKNEFTAGIYAGETSPFSNKIGIRLKSKEPIGICTSSGTFGHSLSFGKADAVCVISNDAYIADAFATALCNMVKKDEDINKVLNFASQKKDLIKGVVIVKADKIGAVGELELIKL